MTKTLAEQLRDPFLWERDNVEIRSQAAAELEALRQERHQLQNDLTAARLENDRLNKKCSALALLHYGSPDEPSEGPASLVGALQDVVHTDTGPVRAGHSVKSG